MKKLLLLSSALFVSSFGYSQVWNTVTSQATGFSEASRGIDEIEIVSPDIVWAKAYNGADTTIKIQEFTMTTNGGATWTAGFIDIGDTSLELTNLSAVNATTAWAGAVSASDGNGGVWKTIDGGVTWNQQNSSAYTTSGSSFFNVVHFFDENNGITEGDPIAGKFEVYRTSDGGNTWSTIPSANIAAASSGEYGYNGGNVAAGNSFWFVTNLGKLYRTTDKGVTWTKLNTPITDFGSATASGRVDFSDDNNGILVGSKTVGTVTTTTLYKTTDGGTTWDAGTVTTSIYLTGGSSEFVKNPGGTPMLVANGRTGTTPNFVYTTAYSTDFGTTWTVVPEAGTARQKSVISMLTPTLGWSGGFNADDVTDGMFKFTYVPLGVDTVNSNKLTVSPNPTSGNININSTVNTINEVSVYNLLGKQVLNTKFSAVNNVNVDLSSLQSGVYLLNATSDKGAVETFKIVKN